MTKTKRALTATAITAAASAIALVPATAQAHHAQPRQIGEVTSVMGRATFTQLSTHDQVLIRASGVSDDGNGTFQIRSDAGNATGKVICVTGSQVTDGATDAAIGLHINRSTIDGLPRGTDAIEYVRDGGRGNPDGSGLVTGTANCPDAGFTVPDGVLVQVPDSDRNNGFGNNGNDNNGRFDHWNTRWSRGHHRQHHHGHSDRDAAGYTVRIRG
jgi:hypothetical protein